MLNKFSHIYKLPGRGWASSRVAARWRPHIDSEYIGPRSCVFALVSEILSCEVLYKEFEGIFVPHISSTGSRLAPVTTATIHASLAAGALTFTRATHIVSIGFVCVTWRESRKNYSVPGRHELKRGHACMGGAFAATTVNATGTARTRAQIKSI